MKMSQNKYMHPRNIYKTSPNFKELAIKFPEFRKFAKQEITGKVTVDFKDPEALRTLTTTLLQKDFGLRVDIPNNRLVPTLPLRLNYLLWIEDLMQLTISQNEAVRGVDIGTGASCIYPLLAATTKKWNMLATEVDPESVICAKKNVENNNLENLINVMQVEPGTILKNVLDVGCVYDFIMCNPPFFSSERDADSCSKSRSPSRTLPHNGKTGSIAEVVVKGGEVAFILQMIKESAELKNVVRIYTTMVGHKSSLKDLKLALEEVGVASSTLTEFCQGHTTRWGLAWTFSSEYNLEKFPRNKKKKEKPPMKYIVPVPKDQLLYTTAVITNKLKILFTKLQIEWKEQKAKNQSSVLEIVAHKNTWSHQRRKRREHKKNIDGNKSSEDASSLVSSLHCQTPNRSEKRKAEVLDPGTDFKRPKNEESGDEEKQDESFCGIKPEKSQTSEDANTSTESIQEYFTENKDCTPYIPREEIRDGTDQSCCVLRAMTSVRKVCDEIHVEMAWLEGSAGRDALHQILQYIKNNLKLE